MTDHELLSAYAEHRSDAHFADLVARHAGWVRAAAVRSMGETPGADDVVQAVFVALAIKADRVGRTDVTAWLFRATRYAVAHARRSEHRRQKHERAAAQTEVAVSTTDRDWEPLVPLLDELVEGLATRDREAVLLRFYRQLPLAEVGAALGVSEQAARAQVRRAVDQLRLRFAKRGVTVPTADGLSALLLANVAHPISPEAVATLARGACQARSQIPVGRPVLGIVAAVGATALVAGVAVLRVVPVRPPPPTTPTPKVPIANTPTIDESAVPGDLHIVRWDVLLTPTAAGTVAALGHSLGGVEHVYRGLDCDAAELKRTIVAAAAAGGVAGSDRPTYAGSGLPQREPGEVLQLGGPFFFDNGTNLKVQMSGQFGGAEPAGGPTEEARPLDDTHLRLKVNHLTGKTSSSLAITEPDGRGQYASDVGIFNAGIHYDGPLALGRAIAFMGRMRAGSGAVYEHLMVWEPFRLNANDAMALSMEQDSVGWCRLGPGTLRAWSIAARARGAGGTQARADDPAFTRQLDGGATVHLDGLARPTGFPFSMWDPHGAWSAEPFYQFINGDPSPGLWASVRVSGSHEFDPPWPQGSRATYPESDGAGTTQPIGDHDTSVDVGVLVGRWTEAGRIRPDAPLTIGPATYRIVPWPAEARWQRTGPLGDDLADFVTAVGPNGLERAGHFAEYVHVRRTGAPTVTTAGSGYADIPDPIAKKDVAFYRLWRRRRQWVRFDGFATEPCGRLTSMPGAPASAGHGTVAR